MKGIDKAKVRRDNPLSTVASRYTKVFKTANDQYMAICPFHNDTVPSLSISDKDGFHCHSKSCDAQGDVFEFIMRIEKIDFNQAIEHLSNEKNLPPAQPVNPLPKRGPGRPPKPLGPVVAEYNYTDEEGVLLYQLRRHDPKDFRQRRPGNTDIGEKEWINNLNGVKKVPYRLHELVKSVKSVFLVEGEKDADSLVALGFTATTTGSSSSWKNYHAKYFMDRDVVVMPDNDDAGREYASNAIRGLDGIAKSVKWVRLPEEVKDVSEWIEAGGTKEELIQIARDTKPFIGEKAKIKERVEKEREERKRIAQEKSEKKKEIEKEKEERKRIDQEESKKKKEIEKKEREEWTKLSRMLKGELKEGRGPFSAMGSFEGSYYFFNNVTWEVKQITFASIMAPAQLVRLASSEYWTSVVGCTNGLRPRYEDAGEYCVKLSNLAGIFSPERVRGRGGWYDEGRSVIHLGDRLLVDGKKIALNEMTTNFIYQRAMPIEGMEITEDLKAEQGRGLFQIIKSLPLEYERDATFLLGFCFLATICGALQWRPHLWLTGSKGTGKSWILDNVIKVLLGKVSARINSSSTEAGVRQMLKFDAFPVVFDESESDAGKGKQRLQDVIELARQASTESSAVIIKGSPSGKAMAFKTRSMFIFSSINVAIQRESDNSRFCVLSLRKSESGNDGLKRFKELQKQVNRTLTPAFCASFRSRAYNRIPQIRKNIETFVNALRESGRDGRYSEQIGTLAGGAYSATSDLEIDPITAIGYLENLHLDEYHKDDVLEDEVHLHNHLRHAQITVNLQQGNPVRLPVSELYQRIKGVITETVVTQLEAEDALKRHGFRVEGTNLVVSNSHSAIKDILKDTPWETGHPGVLIRIEGAYKKALVDFHGVKTRAVCVPQDY